MSNVKYVSKNESVVRGEGTSYQIANFITKDISEKVSVAVSELTGEAPKTMNVMSDRIYYFLDGEADFVFEDQTIRIQKDSALFIPAYTKYKMTGHFRAVLVNAPAFDVTAEKHFYV